MVTINPQDLPSGQSVGTTSVAGTNRGFVSQTDPVLAPVATYGSNVAWGPVIGGAVGAIAILLMLGALGYAVELSMNGNATVNNPSNPAITGTPNGPNFSWGAAIWAWISTAIAFYAGGMIAGIGIRGRYRASGMIHGFLVWALVLTLGLVVSAVAVNAYLVPSGATVYRGNLNSTLTAAAWSTFIGLTIGMIASIMGGGAGCAAKVKVD